MSKWGLVIFFVLALVFVKADLDVGIGNNGNINVVEMEQPTATINYTLVNTNSSEYWITTEGILDNVIDIQGSWITNDLGWVTSSSGGYWSIDNIYLNNVSGVLTLNETLMNATIDARVSAGTDTHVAGYGIYLYNDSNTMYLNETKLNATIDARDDVGSSGGTGGGWYNTSTITSTDLDAQVNGSLFVNNVSFNDNVYMETVGDDFIIWF